MPRAGDDGHPRVRDQARHPVCGLGVALVALSRNQEDRTAKLVQPVPDRRRRALARAAQELGELAWIVAEPARTLRGTQLFRLGRENGLRLPALHDVLDRVALDPRGELLVAAAPLLAVIDPGGHADQHESAEPIRLAERRVECD